MRRNTAAHEGENVASRHVNVGRRAHVAGGIPLSCLRTSSDMGCRQPPAGIMNLSNRLPSVPHITSRTPLSSRTAAIHVAAPASPKSARVARSCACTNLE
jgi:hypothetical protein